MGGSHMTDLITLTAYDLDGCSVLNGSLVGEEKLIHYLNIAGRKIFAVSYGIKDSCPENIHLCVSVYEPQIHVVEEIQCHPHDYIRAWLGPRMQMFPWANSVALFGGKEMRVERIFEGYTTMEVAINCPPAIATAIGGDVWRKTESGWEVVK